MKTNIFKEKLFWTILICLLIGFIAFEIFRDSLTKFENIINLLNAMAACLTFGISYLLFDKFGIKKTVIEKQFDATIEIIQELKKIRILYDFEFIENGMKLTIEFGQVFIRRDMTTYRQRTTDRNIDRKDIPILLNVQDFYNGTGNLSKALTNIWIPLEIKDKFDFLNISKFSRPVNVNDMNTISIAFSSGVIRATPPVEFHFAHDQDLTFGKLIDFLESGLTECENWINKNADHDFRLNI